MPIHSGSDSKGPFIQWGNQKKYHYKKGDKKSLSAAKSKANKQMKAIFANMENESICLKQFNLVAEEILNKLK